MKSTPNRASDPGQVARSEQERPRELGRPQSVQAHAAALRQQALASVWVEDPARPLPTSGLLLPAEDQRFLRRAALETARQQRLALVKQETPRPLKPGQRFSRRPSSARPVRVALRSRTAPLLTALLLAGTLGSAVAQQISTSLPLTSVGDRLLWAVGDQTLTLNVPLDGQVKLELYSPQIDPADYRSDSYYGDETYAQQGDKGAVSTRFELTDQGGKVVAAKDYPLGAQSWDTFFDTALPAGTYKLRAVTRGNAKNTFALRLSGASASVSAERLTVNVHSQSFVPVLNVTVDGPGYALQMYDGDGAGELEAQLRDASGQVYPLTVSGDLASASLPLPAAPGHYTVELRQPVTAKQYSNTVGFSLTRHQLSRPITLADVDTLGLLRVEAELILPGRTAPAQLPLTVGAQTVSAEPFEAKTPAGRYPVTVPPVSGASVLAPDSVSVHKGETSVVRVQVRPSVALSLSADKPEVCVGDVVTFSARASTDYAGELPLALALTSDALKLDGTAAQTGVFSAAKPATVQVQATATRSGDFSVTATLGPWSDIKALGVKVLPDVTSFQLSRDELPSALPGSEVTVDLTLKNTADSAQPYQLSDDPGAALEALDSPEFSGTLQPGETKKLSYRARVTGEASTLKASLSGSSVNGVACGVPQTSQTAFVALTPAPLPQPPSVEVPAVEVPLVEVPVHPAPEVLRRSTVTLPFRVPVSARSLVVGHAFPAGASYVAGSSKLDGQPLPDPLVGASGQVYYVITPPAADSQNTSDDPAGRGKRVGGTISYDLTHSGALAALAQPSLLARYDRGRQEVLQGSLDSADLAGARAVGVAQVAAPLENEGSIKLPLAGTVFHARDRIGLAVEGTLGAQLVPTVNGLPIPETQIGTRVSDPAQDLQRLEYVGVPIKQGENVIALGNQTIKVYLAGPTASVVFTPLSLVADGGTPLRLKVQALDSAGIASGEGYLTLSSSLEPLTPDANPGDAGYQIALHDGVGELVLQPQATPTVLNLAYLVGRRTETLRFSVVPDGNTVGVGVLSATLGLPGGLDFGAAKLGWQGRASYEGPLLGGKLYLAADKDGLPTSTNPYLRYPVSGDSSLQTIPLQGIDPLAVNYDHPNFHAQYLQGAVPISVFQMDSNLTALSGATKTNPSVSGFVALVPGDLKTETLIPSGTRLLRLSNANLSPDSASVQIVATRNGLEISRSALTPYVDYVLDPTTGIITLTRGLEPVDANLNTLSVVVNYRLNDPLAGRTLGYGAETRYEARSGSQNFSVAAAVVSLDSKLTSGVRASYDSGNSGNGALKANVLAAYSGGVQVAADLSASFGGAVGAVQAHYQDTGYSGLNAGSAGTSISANAAAPLTQNLSAVVAGEYHSVPAASAAVTGGVLDSSGGSVSARADYRISPFSVGLGAKYAFGDIYGVGAVAAAGYHLAPFDLDITHTQPLSGNLQPVSDLSARVAIGKATLGLRDTLTWGGDNVASLSLGTTLGNTNYALSYDLPTASGAGNRARFGVDTALPLSDRLKLGLRASLLRDMKAGSSSLNTGADLSYASDSVNASLGGDLSYDGTLLTSVLRGGVTGTVSKELTLSADGTLDLTPGNFGARAAVGYAYRGSAWQSLGYLRYLDGSLSAGKPELSAGASAEYHQPQLALRAGADSRTLLSDPSSFTYQLSAGGTYYVSDLIGIGAWSRALMQPATGIIQFGYGLEGSFRALPGTWLTAGYNFAGFDGLGNNYTKPGLYLRLDVTLDETLGGRK
ncbi:DUF11 domain-containing protein [Deinococcus sp.]|uniref:DUF11 domain-containing protein n=1 Tax=Deinococcus sp. TaxID=47478 RepID=UPI003CC5A275